MSENKDLSVHLAEEKGFCPICDESTFVYHKTVLGGLILQRCKNCSLIKLKLNENTEEFVQNAEGRFYGEDATESITWWDKKFSMDTANGRMDTVTKYKQGGDMLEIGCGPGALLREAKKRGFNPVGVEYSPSMARYASSASGVKVYQGDIEQAHFDNNAFDIVVMHHVIEHLANPLRTLECIRRISRPGSILHISAPNVDSWGSMFQTWHSYDESHLFYFSPDTIKTLLERLGYKVLFLGSAESPSVWFNTITRGLFWTQYTRYRVDGPSSKESTGKRRLLKHIINVGRVSFGVLIAPLRWVQVKCDKGSELFVIAELQKDSETSV